eukprot:m.250366 g.250366  ORF g.250366 m.250366 type:complete len:56 (-) comp33883_c0_seq6:158-325(-)
MINSGFLLECKGMAIQPTPCMIQTVPPFTLLKDLLCPKAKSDGVKNTQQTKQNKF